MEMDLGVYGRMGMYVLIAHGIKSVLYCWARQIIHFMVVLRVSLRVQPSLYCSSGSRSELIPSSFHILLQKSLAKGSIPKDLNIPGVWQCYREKLVDRKPLNKNETIQIYAKYKLMVWLCRTPFIWLNFSVRKCLPAKPMAREHYHGS